MRLSRDEGDLLRPNPNPKHGHAACACPVMKATCCGELEKAVKLRSGKRAALASVSEPQPQPSSSTLLPLGSEERPAFSW